ncbi:MAG: DUF4093 domain-containing protein [Clostridia bacterium]|nr:DUF4093 domain-containing protein [Clostridia bacterium]
MEKLKIPYTIIVEGKYDRLKLLNICEARIIATDGFGIFKKNEKLALIRKLAEKMPIILLTDSDGAGKVIRSHIASAIPANRIIQLYTPQIKGKERRKTEASAEGFLGVEGIENKLLYDLLSPYEDESAYLAAQENPISKADFYEDGLMGKEDSTRRRDALAKRLGLPCGMTSNALLSAIKLICSYEEYKELVKGI